MKKIILILVMGGLIGFCNISFASGNFSKGYINPGGPVLGLKKLNTRSISLTIYNQNLALVRDIRNIKLEKGKRTINISNIPASIEPTSVYFKSLTNPQGCFILSQNFENNIVNSENLLDRYIGKKISVITKNNIYEGELLSNQSGEVILAENIKKGPVFMINSNYIENIKFSQLPQGLLIKPALIWYLENNNSGIQKIEIDYLTTGINWNSNYVAIMAKDKRHISLQGWATIDNKSGADYKNANLKLIAGQVNIIEQQPTRPVFFGQEDKGLRVFASSIAPQFQEKPSFEYYAYTLNRKITIKNNQTKQISLLKALEIPIKKIYTYDGAGYSGYYYNNWENQPYNKNVSVNIQFKNSKKNNLGIPLPSGLVRVYKKDADGSLQLIGENQINNIPKNEKVSLYLGNAFNIKGKRKITDHKIIAQNIYMDSYKITLKNHKKQPVTVNVIEHQFGQWHIIKSSIPYKKINANTIEFKPVVGQGKSFVITYTSQYKF